MHEFLGASSRFMGRRLQDLLDVVYPPVCGLCGSEADSDDRLICIRCRDSIEGLEAPYCARCRAFIHEKTVCPECRKADMIIFSLGYFDRHLKTILHDLKFSGLKPLAATLGRKLAERIASHPTPVSIDVILPVPLHHTREYQRGFNQSEEIAREIGRCLGIAMRPEILYAARRTRQQARLPVTEREANVRGAYAVDDEGGYLRGKRVLLVDDVTTTGATLRENARVLRESGARRVIAAVAATAL